MYIYSQHKWPTIAKLTDQSAIKSVLKIKNHNNTLDTDNVHKYIICVPGAMRSFAGRPRTAEYGGYDDGKLAHGLARRLRPGAQPKGWRLCATPCGGRPAAHPGLHHHPAAAHVRAGLAGRGRLCPRLSAAGRARGWRPSARSRSSSPGAASRPTSGWASRPRAAGSSTGSTTRRATRCGASCWPRSSGPSRSGPRRVTPGVPEGVEDPFAGVRSVA